MSKSTFPLQPIDGQQYIDQNNVKWIYDRLQNEWVWIGPVIKLPIAKSGNNCIGQS